MLHKNEDLLEQMHANIAPWKERYDKPKQLLQSRDSTLPTKVWIVKAMVFLIVMYRCENWTIKKTEQLKN